MNLAEVARNALAKSLTDTGDLATWVNSFATIVQAITALVVFIYVARTFSLEKRKDIENERDRILGLVHGVCAWIEEEADSSLKFAFFNSSDVPIYNVKVRICECIVGCDPICHLKTLNIIAPKEKIEGFVSGLKSNSRKSRKITIYFSDVRNINWERDNEGVLKITQN